MSKCVHLLLCFFISLGLVASKSVPKGSNRQGRWFGGQYTSTEIVPKLVTAWVASSCLQVQPSLPPCKGINYVEKFPRFLRGDRQSNLRYENDDTVHTTQLGWGEYLGIYAPTVTVTAVELRTTTVMDPRVVVTFALMGCTPSHMPSDLSLCPSQIPPVIPDIHPSVSSAQNPIMATASATPDGFAKPTSLDHSELVNNNLENLQAQAVGTDEVIEDQHPGNQLETQPLELKTTMIN